MCWLIWLMPLFVISAGLMLYPEPNQIRYFIYYWFIKDKNPKHLQSIKLAIDTYDGYISIKNPCLNNINIYWFLDYATDYSNNKKIYLSNQDKMIIYSWLKEHNKKLYE